MSEQKKQAVPKGTDKKEIEIPEKFKQIVSEIEKMSVLDLSELVKVLEEKFGVSQAMPMAVAAMPNASEGIDAAPKEEKTEFNVELTAIGENKINVIKAIREVLEMGLKDAKDLTEKAPVILKENMKKEDAENLKKKIEEAGGKVTLK